MSVDVLVQLLDADLPMPSYADPGDAGADLVSRVDLTLAPGERAMIPTGIAVALPPGYVALIHPRSGLAAKHGISMVNSPGVVDAGYRGELNVLLINHGQAAVNIKRGERIAQMLIQQVEHARLHHVETLPGSHRGSGGFGSTGS